MKKTTAILSVATISTMMISSVTAFADQTIDGRIDETSGDVLVNGIIGSFDNETDGPDPVDMNQWINVTMPTTALFYTTGSNHETITSPEYSITNNSAVGVIVTASSVHSEQDMDDVATLNINNIPLFENGTSVIEPTQLFTLVGTVEGDSKDVKSFGFSGTSSANDTIEQNPSFNLVLNFEASRDVNAE